MINPRLAQVTFETLCVAVSSSVGLFVAYALSGSVVVGGITMVFCASMFACIISQNK